MAEAYLRHFAGDAVEVVSAGTQPAERPEGIVVRAMAEDGIDISHAKPKLLDSNVVKKANMIITMGCDVQDVPRIDEDWGLPDPKERPIERVRQIRDMAKERARELADRLRATSAGR
jgi:arsenate reductase